MRALKVLVVVMGVLIIAASATLVVMIVQRAGKAVPAAVPAVPALAPVPGPVVSPANMALGQPPGSRIGGIAAAGEGRVAVWVQRPDGDRLVILDTRAGRPAGEVRLGE